MNATEIEVYEMDTSKGCFGLKVYEDAEGSDYVGKIDGPSLPFDQAIPGHPPDYSREIVAEEYRDPAKDKLIERCKERITELGGRITVCRKA